MAVSCTPGKACATVGGSTILTGGARQLSFDSTASPLGSVARATLRDVSCPPSGPCRAVGVGHIPSGDVPFAEFK